MAKHILRCNKCAHYTLHEECSCGGKPIEVKPPKFSPEDPYGEYRRKAKEQAWQEQGFL